VKRTRIQPAGAGGCCGLLEGGAIEADTGGHGTSAAIWNWLQIVVKVFAVESDSPMRFLCSNEQDDVHEKPEINT
jgi:hypothetical protein